MNPPGETNLPALLSSLDPILDPETPQPLQPQMLFQESEGITIITTRNLASTHGFAEQATFPCRKISLKVHSSLEAVGLIATIAAALKECGISSNVISGYFHDHIFVPVGREDEALQALRDLAKEAEG
ncbi:hypothetical protein ACJ72_06625 [Emergomyces africanus]|uniref:Uncharacterized protein n=1 Tax=Emergomyces africanus TaxID=1955775 RepID=A0A1B7NQK4_9EURO|nr:hypothetical protein ACJ72_06625 [Emergomyces africanus]